MYVYVYEYGQEKAFDYEHDYEHEHDSLIPLLFVIFVSSVLFVVLP